MSLPDLVFSSQSLPSVFVGGRAFPVQKHIDYEWGPIAISDPSKGSMYQIWRARMENDFVYLSAPNVPEFVLLDLPNVTEISFTFDQNARHIFVYVQAGVVKMHWYDTSVSEYVTTVFSGDVITPRITLDDKRELQRGISDVVLFYVKPTRNAQGVQIGGDLYMRMQRDRYGIEYHMATQLTGGVVKCGMMNNWRVGVQLEQYSPATLVVDPQEPVDNVISICHFDSESSDRVPDARLTSTWVLRDGAIINNTVGKFGGCLDISANGRAVLFNRDATINNGEYQFELYTTQVVSPVWKSIISQYGSERSGGNSVLFDIQQYNNRLIFRYWDDDGVSNITELGNFDLSNSFNHIAVTFSAGDFKNINIFINGEIKSSILGANISKATSINTQVMLGKPSSQDNSTGVRLIDEFRATSEITYTSNFTPPQAPFE